MGRELPASSRSGLCLWSDRCLRLRARQTANAYLALSLSCAIVPASGLRTVQVFASLTRLSSSPNDLIPSYGHPLTRRPSHPRTNINTASTIHPPLESSLPFQRACTPWTHWTRARTLCLFASDQVCCLYLPVVFMYFRLLSICVQEQKPAVCRSPLIPDSCPLLSVLPVTALC